MTASLVRYLAQSAAQPTAIIALAGVFGVVVLLLVVPDYILAWRRRRALGKIPLVGQGCMVSPWSKKEPTCDLDEEISKAYEKYTRHGKAFAIPNVTGDGAFVVLPPQSCREWCMLSKQHHSWTVLMTDEMLLKDVGLSLDWKIASDAIHAANRISSIQKVQPDTIREIDTFLTRNPTSGKTAAEPDEKAGSVAINLSTTMALLCVDLTVQLTFHRGFGKDVDLAHQLLAFIGLVQWRTSTQQEYPLLVRPLVRQYGSTTRLLRSTIATLKKTIIPEVRYRIEQRRAGKVDGPNGSYMDAMVDIALKRGLLRSKTDQERCENLIAEHTMLICFELVTPITMVITILLFQISLRPEYLEPLREELVAALRRREGKWDFDLFEHTPKLESFTRECYRLNPPSTLAGGRQLLQPLHLPSLGLTLQPGTKIALPARWVQRDEDHYPNPTEFDGYRFYDRTAGTCDIGETITPTETWLPFAIGVATCPARRMGTRIAQVVFSKILLDYEFDLDLRDRQPHFFHVVGSVIPNPDVMMHVRKRLAPGTSA